MLNPMTILQAQPKSTEDKVKLKRRIVVVATIKVQLKAGPLFTILLKTQMRRHNSHETMHVLKFASGNQLNFRKTVSTNKQRKFYSTKTAVAPDRPGNKYWYWAIPLRFDCLNPNNYLFFIIC